MGPVYQKSSHSSAWLSHSGSRAMAARAAQIPAVARMRLSSLGVIVSLLAAIRIVQAAGRNQVQRMLPQGSSRAQALSTTTITKSSDPVDCESELSV